jgi:hypothetical protein
MLLIAAAITGAVCDLSQRRVSVLPCLRRCYTSLLSTFGLRERVERKGERNFFVPVYLEKLKRTSPELISREAPRIAIEKTES